MALAGAGAGLVSGLFGAGGGLVLVPLLGFLGALPEKALFGGSVAVIAPIAAVSLLFSPPGGDLSFTQAFPYAFGGAVGAVPAVFWGRNIPAVWLHRGLGCLILWGGVRYLL